MTPVTPGLSWLVGWQRTFFEVAVSTIQPGASAEIATKLALSGGTFDGQEESSSKEGSPREEGRSG